MVSKGSLGGGGMDEGFGQVILAALLGAFCGLLLGLMMSHLAQYFSFLMGRQVSGHLWTIASAVLGAVGFACWAAWGNGAGASMDTPGGIAEQ